MFQTTDREGRAAWLAAVERFVVWCGIAPVFLASLPASIAILGPAARARRHRARHSAPRCSVFETLLPRMAQAAVHLLLPARQAARLVLILRAVLWRSRCSASRPADPLGSAELAAFIALVHVRRRWSGVGGARSAGATWAAVHHALGRDSRRRHRSAGPAAASRQETGIVSTPAPHRAPEMFSPAAGRLARHPARRPGPRRSREDRRNPRRSARDPPRRRPLRLRLIRRNPLLSAVVVLTLTVGIGINASVFTVVNGIDPPPARLQGPAIRFVRIFPETADRELRAAGLLRGVHGVPRPEPLAAPARRLQPLSAC